MVQVKRNNQRLSAGRDVKDHIQPSHFASKKMRSLAKVKEFAQTHSVINDILRTKFTVTNLPSTVH